MKGIILVGGIGLRLYLIMKVMNKYLFFVGWYLMIYYVVYKLK